MKNKIAIVTIIISLIAMSAYAEALFENAYLSELRVIKADEQAGWALIQDRAGNQGDVVVGDSIGWEQAEVVAIEKAAIMVEQEDLKTRIPVVDPFADD
ncbi:hypothetical protein [uncultured Desulfosarcina sp.]|uniref:hypothetical protein n=1 Tax=uncultured Desulfosarcina sp. TaxID=218289 RepID=UPI0029C9A6F5|nr:hypothetical protein [uncultured Desulfosarcina sp.]